MVKVEDESRAPVEGRCGNILGCGVVDGDGDGGEEFHGVEIAGNGTVSGTIAGSVSGEGGFSAEKPIHEARYVNSLCLKLMLTSLLFRESHNQSICCYLGKVTISQFVVGWNNMCFNY